VDHQIKLRGYRIELGEIEASLRRHLAIRDAVVLTHRDQPDNSHLVGYVVADGEPPSVAALRQHLKDWLPEYMIPSAFVVLPAFPRTPSGKVDRDALSAAFPAQPAPAAEPEWTLPIQEIIADTFKRVLHLDHFDAGDNFFDKGGRSLQVVEAASQLEHVLAQPISPAWIFQAPTPHELAPFLDAMLVTPTSHIAPLQPLGDRVPLICLNDLFGRPITYASLARILAPRQPVYGLVPGPLEDAIIANPTLDVLTPAYVAAIRAIQPRGPYRVAGYSYGGLPAFDVAQALLAEGEDVLLIMIDPYIYRAVPAMAAAKWVSRRGGRALKDIWTADRPAMPRMVGTAGWANRQGQRVIKKFREDFSRRHMPPGAVAASKVPAWVSPAGRPLAMSLLQAEGAYQYRPYSGKAVFIQGTIRDLLHDFLNADGLNGWGGLFKGPLTRLELPARHDWMMRDPAVSEVAEIMQSL
jgi:thioesterase domain-containing protein